ncbi:hypothetical protein T05_14198 [Trichinella murrelli]|uniref:Uncharacterized protein n=1 Tax=Trichinella murrelli TaxID=144512 RepID=A0A0V0UAK0_9BILA|nr:hypothetical protein T05_14198 [Trichinella murrelli]
MTIASNCVPVKAIERNFSGKLQNFMSYRLGCLCENRRKYFFKISTFLIVIIAFSRVSTHTIQLVWNTWAPSLPYCVP